MTDYPTIHQPIVIRAWLQVALLLAVAFGAYQLGVNHGSRPPECKIKIGTITTKCECNFDISAPKVAVKILPRVGEEFAP